MKEELDESDSYSDSDTISVKSADIMDELTINSDSDSEIEQYRCSKPKLLDYYSESDSC